MEKESTTCVYPTVVSLQRTVHTLLPSISRSVGRPGPPVEGTRERKERKGPQKEELSTLWGRTRGKRDAKNIPSDGGTALTRRGGDVHPLPLLSITRDGVYRPLAPRPHLGVTCSEGQQVHVVRLGDLVR